MNILRRGVAFILRSRKRGIMTASRLHLPGPTQRRISISLLAAEQVERGLGQVPCYGSDGSAMTLALAQVPVEPAPLTVRTPRLIHRHRVGSLGKRPLQITVHVRSRASVAGAVAAGVYARRGARLAGQVLGAGEAGDVADLQLHRRRQNHPHSRQAHQPLHLDGDFDQPRQPLLELLDWLAERIDLRQHLLAGPAGLLRQSPQARPQFRSRPLPTRVARRAGVPYLASATAVPGAQPLRAWRIAPGACCTRY
jgi:hypothetical protein